MKSPNTPHRPAVRPFVVGLILVLMAVTGTVSWQAYQSRFVYALEVDGELLGYLEQKQDWLDALEETREWAREEAGGPVVLESEISLTRVLPAADAADTAGGPLLSRETLGEVCRAELSFVTQVWAVRVDGLDVAFLSNQEDAEKVVPELIEDYRGGLTARGNTVVLSATVKEAYEICRVEASLGRLSDIAQAKRILLRGTDRTEVHVVSRGESLWSIARTRALTVRDLRLANPELANSDLIRVGQKLNLIVPNPYITLQSLERFTYIRYLAFTEYVREDSTRWSWESHTEKAGVRGRNEVVVTISRVNGEEISREVVSETPLSPPSAQTYVLGTKVYPTRVGGFIWPVQGRITSSYGWRGREFHRGLDIGATNGTPIMAVKDGTVSFTGWSGGYGYTVRLDHGGGLETLYAHLSSMSVTVGQSVAAGDVIGRVGSTGRSTGAHLHFEVRVNGDSVNPINYYPRGG